MNLALILNRFRIYRLIMKREAISSKFKVTVDDKHQFESGLARRHAAILVLVLSVVLSELREGVDDCDDLPLCLNLILHV